MRNQVRHNGNTVLTASALAAYRASFPVGPIANRSNGRWGTMG